MGCICNTLGNISRIIIVATCLLALVMQLGAAMSCEMVNVTGSSSEGGWGIFFQGTGAGAFECHTEMYQTDDPLVTGARSALSISMTAGFVALLMVTFEWLFCEVCCAGLLEGLAFLLAWTSGGATFMFYGTGVCVEDGAKCEFTEGSAMLTVSVVCYLACGVLLCFSPQPDPICRSSK